MPQEQQVTNPIGSDLDADDIASLNAFLNEDENPIEGSIPDPTPAALVANDEDDDPDDEELFTSDERANLSKMSKAERNRAKRQRRKERAQQEKLDLQLKDASNQQRIRELEAQLSRIEGYQQNQVVAAQLSRFDQEQNAKKARIAQLEQDMNEAGRMMDFTRQSALQSELIDLKVDYRTQEARRAAFNEQQQNSTQQQAHQQEQYQPMTSEARYTREVGAAIGTFLETNKEHSWLTEEFSDAQNPAGKTQDGRKAMQIFRSLAQEQDPRTSGFYFELSRRLQKELPNKYNNHKEAHRNSPPMQTTTTESRNTEGKPTVGAMMSKLSPEERSVLKSNMQAMKEAGYLKTEQSQMAFIKSYVQGVR